MTRFLLILSLFCCSNCFAEDFIVQNFKAGDGTNGSRFAKWQFKPNERSIEKVDLKLRRIYGDKNTYINLRFGTGEAFEGGKRIYLEDDSARTITWHLHGEVPAGRQLVLNTYNGGVLVTGVRITYKSSAVFRPLHEKQRGREGNCSQDNVEAPLIEIADIEDRGGLFSGKYRLFGSVYAACVKEAGYYERGKLKEELNFTKDGAEYERRSFEFKVRSGRGGQVKVYLSNGDVSSVSVDDYVK